MRVLILGGTSEASALARALADDACFHATLSLAGVTREPARQPVPVRVGGFGGAAGLAAHLRAERVDALAIATHPFARTIAANAVAAAHDAGVPALLLLRPAWTQGAGDRWTHVPDMEAAAGALGEAPLRVLLTIGRKDLAPFTRAPRHRYVVRSVDAPPPECLPPGATVIAARGPFSLDNECALLSTQRIDALVTKNSGGDATRAKLDAARELGARVVMVARPPPPDGVATVPDVARMLGWLHAGVSRGV